LAVKYGAGKPAGRICTTMTPQFIISASSHIGIGLLVLGIACSLARQSRAAITALSLSLLSFLAFYAARAWLKEFFPFTDKIESFVVLSVLLVACALAYRKNISNKEFIALQVLALASASVIYLFVDVIRYPPMFLHTIWYPLHIPVSFAAYAFWLVAGVSALFAIPAWNRNDPVFQERSQFMTSLNRIGFIFFTLAMLFGGIWGYFAWGAYFMWDPKLHWAVILWLYYGNLLHMDRLPAFRVWKVPLYIAGIVMILVAFIGTSFFSQSIHRF
jgi:ABC-type transport system involved in cytochrome c biogenesis permease subunit